MDQVNQMNRNPLHGNRDRLFLYEVVLSSPSIPSQTGQTYSNRRATLFLKVPYERMSQEMKRIAQLGGTIVRITPISDLDSSPHSHSSLPWWVEISTQIPRCLYYFGPFESQEEAIINQNGYGEDLMAEGAVEIKINILQAEPEILTQEWD